MISLKYCILNPISNGIETVFQDNTISTNWPPQDELFQYVVRQCGFNDDHIFYIRHHDLSHAFLSEKMFDRPSPVLWNAAHEISMNETSSLFEERWVYHWQRYTMNQAKPLEKEWSDWLVDWHNLPLQGLMLNNGSTQRHTR
jgi:hypothetical protein